MGDIVNLKLHRKRWQRAAKEDQSAENRVAFGRSKIEKKLTEAEQKKSAKDLDGKKLED